MKCGVLDGQTVTVNSLASGRLLYHLHIDRDSDIVVDHECGIGADSEIAPVNARTCRGSNVPFALRILDGLGRAIHIEHNLLSHTMDRRRGCNRRWELAGINPSPTDGQ